MDDRNNYFTANFGINYSNFNHPNHLGLMWTFFKIKLEYLTTFPLKMYSKKLREYTKTGSKLISIS